MGHRYRWWYRMTGLPGWMRFGFSPGWLGRSPYGLGPAAQYLMYGTWPTPQMNYYMPAGQVPPVVPPNYYPPAPGFPAPYAPYGAAPIAPEQELDMLKGQAEILEDELDGIKKRIEEIELGKKEPVAR
jgi:hypothetical protein